MTQHSKACVDLGLPPSVRDELPILEKALGCAAFMNGNSDEEIRREEDKFQCLTDHLRPALLQKDKDEIESLYRQARMHNIAIKLAAQEGLTPGENSKFVSLTEAQWKDLMKQIATDPTHKKFSTSAQTNKGYAEPWSVIYVLVVEPMRGSNRNRDKASFVLTTEGDLIIKKYMFIIIDRHHAGCTALRITSKNGQGMAALDCDEEKAEYEYVYNSSRVGKMGAGIELAGVRKFDLDEESMVHLVPTEIPFQSPCFPTGLRVNDPQQRKDILNRLKFEATPERLAEPDMSKNVFNGHPSLRGLELLPVALQDNPVFDNESVTPESVAQQFVTMMGRLGVPPHSLTNYIPGPDTASSGVGLAGDSNTESGAESSASPTESMGTPPTSHSPSPVPETLASASLPGPAPIGDPDMLNQMQSKGQNSLKRKSHTTEANGPPSKKSKTVQTNAGSNVSAADLASAANTASVKGDTGITSNLGGLRTDATAGAAKRS